MVQYVGSVSSFEHHPGTLVVRVDKCNLRCQDSIYSRQDGLPTILRLP